MWHSFGNGNYAEPNQTESIIEPALSYAILPWLGLKLSYNFEYKDTDYVRTSTTNYNHATDADRNYTKKTTTHYDYIDHRVMLSIVLDY